jgi:hypothetical protein
MSDAQTAIAFLDRLAVRGRDLRTSLAAGAPPAATDAMRRWQGDVASTVNELSGGSKAHWLSRAFSGAFLIQAPQTGDRELLVEASPAEIVDRLLHVIGQARASLAQVAAGGATAPEQGPHRFDFVQDAAIRPVLEQAYLEGERALERDDADTAFQTFSSLLEAIITDALRADVSTMSFGERITAAETAGLIRGGCARLPAAARRYRDRSPSDEPVTIRDANVVRQVLRVVMRDLDPGR